VPRPAHGTQRLRPKATQAFAPLVS
jgi:hypothetical protein